MVKHRVIFGYAGGFVLTKENEAELTKNFPECDFQFGNISTFSPEDFSDAEVLIGNFYANEMQHVKKLQWLQAATAGTDRYRPFADPKKTFVTTCHGLFNRCMGEHTLAMMLAYSRSICLYRDSQKIKETNRHFIPMDLFESTVGIVGLGGIGTETAKLAKGCGMRVIASKRQMCPKPEYIDELYLQDDLDKLLVQSDFVVLSLPLSSSTQNLISKRELSLMKPSACLVNVARGAIVDTDALIEALQNKVIAGACLDTTMPEPLDQESPLWNMPNVFITPHVANESPSTNRFRYDFIVKNLQRYLNGEPLLNQVSSL